MILRPFHVYGEGESENRFWPSLKKAALAGGDLPMTEGNQMRDFLNVTEVARQFVAVLSQEPPAKGHARLSNVGSGIPIIQNVGTGKPQSLPQFAEFWWNERNAKGKLLVGAIPYRTGEVIRYVPEI